jgi:hypothetical protein
MFRNILILAGSLVLSLAPVFAAGTVDPEKQKQTDFKKACASPDKDERGKAYALFEGSTDPSSWDLMVKALSFEKESSVKIEGFTVLSKLPARTGALATKLAQLFNALEKNDMDTRLAYAKAMSSSEFKYEDAGTVAQFIWMRCSYPDMPTYQGMHQGNMVNTRSPEAVNKIRKEFKDFLEALNGIVKTDVSAENLDRNAPAKLKKWWEANSAKVATDDRALADKYREEDKEKERAAK